MFVETKRDGELITKDDPFQIKSLISWLQTKIPGEQYCYSDNGLCLLGQYFTEHGFSKISMSSHNFAVDDFTRFYTLPKHFNDIARGDRDGGTWHWTFGEALQRARALLSTEESPS